MILNNYFDKKRLNCCMRILVAALVAAIFPGCMPPVVRMAPSPSRQQLALERQSQVRAIPVPMESVFPRVMDVFMDNGLIIRSVNEKVGFISFYQAWNDTSQLTSPNITIEGAIIFRPLSPNSVQARLLLTGNWQAATREGPDYGKIPRIDAKEYESILDVIEHGLVSR